MEIISVKIDSVTWNGYLANEPYELTQGLAGLSSMPTGACMLFDTGSESLLSVTTEQMQFAIDIVFLDENLEVTEIHSSVMPGNVITAGALARYFLEVNAGETSGISVTDVAAVTIYYQAGVPVVGVPYIVPVASDSGGADFNSLIDMMLPLFMFAIVGAIVVGLMSDEKEKSDYEVRQEELRRMGVSEWWEY